MQIDAERASYYYMLRKSHADLGWKQLRSFPIDQMESGMQERFLDTFRGYVPLYVREVMFPPKEQPIEKQFAT